ncbi:MAG: transposase [bacterium]|jgi:transposase-like protein
MNEVKGRNHYTPEQKYKIVKEALTTNTPVSEICKKYGISSSNFYKWQDLFFEGALEGLNRKNGIMTSAEKRRIESLEKENTRMKDVIAEITLENIEFKKKLGE